MKNTVFVAYEIKEGRRNAKFIIADTPHEAHFKAVHIHGMSNPVVKQMGV